MKQVLASLAAFIRHLLVGRDYGVADRAFGLAFEGASYVLAEDA
jgi:hypothetical protein